MATLPHIAAPTNVDVSTYQGAFDALRSRVLIAEGQQAPVELRGGTVTRMDGPAHTQKRRAMSRLFARENDEHIRSDMLVPLLLTRIEETFAEAGDADRIDLDLHRWLVEIVLPVAAELIGLDVGDDVERTASLRDIHARIASAMTTDTSDPSDPDVAELRAAGIAARDDFDRLFVKPALERRRGEDTSEPTDFLSLHLNLEHGGPWPDHAAVVREAVVAFLFAGTMTSVEMILHAMAEIDRWIQTHPEDEARITDPDFLRAASTEAARLHAPVPGLMRVATADVELADGTFIPEGTRIVVRLSAANCDPTVFGDDADAFRPGRVLPPGVKPYGLAFGAGRHMCYGAPLVLGSEKQFGSVVRVLEELYRAGVRVDRANPPVADRRTNRDIYLSFPAYFDRTADRRSDSP
jgi:cytochrome P450